MKHARIDTPDGFRIVHADGTKHEARDTAGPMLHLLPRLYVGPAVIAACPSPRVACTASIVSPGCVDDTPAAAPEVPAAVEEGIDSGHSAPRLRADTRSGSLGPTTMGSAAPSPAGWQQGHGSSVRAGLGRSLHWACAHVARLGR